jgi:hypothetical protein
MNETDKLAGYLTAWGAGYLRAMRIKQEQNPLPSTSDYEGEAKQYVQAREHLSSKPWSQINALIDDAVVEAEDNLDRR